MAKKQSTDKNGDVQAPEPKWADYQETILVRNPTSGEVDAVSDLVQKGNRYEVHTTEPLTRNAPGFLELKDSGAVAAFIRSFKSQKDNAIDFQFLKVPFNAVQQTIASLLKLNQNPDDPEGKAALRKFYLDTAKLEKVKFDQAEIPRAEIKELGIDFDALKPETQEQMRMGLPVKELVQATVKVSPNVAVSGMFAPRFYRDHNDGLKVALDTPLAHPEFESERYNMQFSTQEKTQLAQGGTLERLISHKDPVTGREDWCFVGMNDVTNRLCFQPKRDVPTPGFTYNARISDEGRQELDRGGSALVEGCHYRNSDNHFSGKISYDIHKGEYVTKPLKYEKPYIPQSIRDQISDTQYQALCNYQPIDGEHIRSRNDKTFKGCDLKIDPKTNILLYVRRELKQSQDRTQEQQLGNTKQSSGIRR